jgi:cytochrome c peroxidase
MLWSPGFSRSGVDGRIETDNGLSYPRAVQRSNRSTLPTLLTALCLGAALAGCDERPFERVAEQQRELQRQEAARLAASAAAAKAPPPDKIDPADLAFFKPLPAVYESADNPITEEKIALGRMLYYETRISGSQTLSCNSCHDLANYGVDNQPTSPGHKGQRGGRNSPTVYNAAGHVAQFWDGRAPNVEEQAKGPILNPIEMAAPNAKYVVEVLKSMPEYVKAFKAAFPKDKDPVSYDNVGKAIGAFERKLTTPTRWDKFLSGDQGAFTEAEKAGFAKFAKLGCPTCHNGPNVGGALFQKLGLVNAYPDQSDLGRYDVTKSDADKMYFRVPTLRNVAKTFPYFHKGQHKTLEETVKTMAYHQLGMSLKDDEIASIVTFLNALTADLPAEYIKKPELPKSTDKTPKPVKG